MHYVTLWSLLTFGQTAFLKRQVAIWFSHTTVARGPGAWSRGEGMLQHLYVASQVGSLDARDRPLALRHVVPEARTQSLQRPLSSTSSFVTRQTGKEAKLATTNWATQILLAIFYIKRSACKKYIHFVVKVSLAT